MLRNNKFNMGLLMVLFFMVFTVTFLFHNNVRAEDENLKTVNYDLIEKIYNIAEKEFFESFNQSDFFNGSFDGIKLALEEQRIKVDNIPVFTYDDSKGKPENFKNFKKQLQGFINRFKTKELTEEKLLNYALEGMIDKLGDPYTVYMDAKEYTRMNESMSGGNFTGIGIYIELDREHNNQLTVTEPIEGTPAYQVGLKPGDWIIKIDGNSTKGLGLDEAVSKIRGPEGTKVILTIQRKDVDEPIDFTIKRAFIHVSSVNSKLLNNNIGYIKLRLFGSETDREIETALSDLEKKGAKAFILDLRNNGGGYVNASIEVCSKFLPVGTEIVSIKDRYGVKQTYKSYGSTHPDHPLVLLINEYSASASEITAGAIRDAKRGMLIGTKTFGKGSVQSIFNLDKEGALKITTAHYFTPRGRNISGKGLKPDIVVEMDEEFIGKDGDVQLEEALHYLKEEIKK